MGVKKDLQDFYNQEAKKYHQSRKKVWHDVERILQEINNYAPIWSSKPRKIKILELGCGAGRFCDYLDENVKFTVDYTGVDLSQSLLDLAKKDHPNQNFICDDMVNFVKDEEQEKYDFVVMTASFQHLPNIEERSFLLKYLYKSLKYEGKVIILNWALSDWFKKKYHNEVRKAFWKFTLSFGKYKWNDIMVPWQSKSEKFYRYYHLFTVEELEELFEETGFHIEKSLYLDRKGQEVDNRGKANNSLVVASKKAFLK